MPQIARKGDMTSHGGTIVGSCSKTIVDGSLVARVGDLTTCPIKYHGATPIVDGNPHFLVEGRPCARVGSKTGCGAVIISGAPKATTS